VVAHQFDICILTTGQWVVVLQADASATSSSIIFAPIVAPAPKQFVHKLNMNVNLDEQDYTIRMQEMSAISPRAITSVIANRADLQQQVMLAIDLLFAGF
jgi:hypothetical protein